MKLTTIVTAIAVAGFASSAFAANPSELMQPITVSATPIAECARQDQASSEACKAADRLIRANFTPSEIRVMNTWASVHPQYLFDKVYALHDRYVAVLQEYVAQQNAAKQQVATKQQIAQK